MAELWLPSRAARRFASNLKDLPAEDLKVIAEPSSVAQLRQLGLKVVSESSEADIRLLSSLDGLRERRRGQKMAVSLDVKGSAGEKMVLKAATMGADYVLVNCPDWKVIPLENLIAKKPLSTLLIAEIGTVDEARTALHTLELGADGISANPRSKEEMQALTEAVTRRARRVPLSLGRVIEVRPAGEGLRVCVDTCEMMKAGEGMLVGSQSSALFLIEAEVHHNPHVDPRPFRVNAGPVSGYILSPDGKTRYLAELGAGDEVLLVNKKGQTRPATVGRVKIEKRPLSLVRAAGPDGSRCSTIVQNAETIRFMTPKGSKPVTSLKSREQILLRIEAGGRHFGTLVKDEFIVER